MSSKNQVVLHPKANVPALLARSGGERMVSILQFLSRAKAGMKVLVCHSDEAGRAITIIDTIAKIQHFGEAGVRLLLVEKPRTDTDYGAIFADEMFVITEVQPTTPDTRVHDPDGARYLTLLDRYAI